MLVTALDTIRIPPQYMTSPGGDVTSTRSGEWKTTSGHTACLEGFPSRRYVHVITYFDFSPVRERNVQSRIFFAAAVCNIWSAPVVVAEITFPSPPISTSTRTDPWSLAILAKAG